MATNSPPSNQADQAGRKRGRPEQMGGDAPDTGQDDQAMQARTAPEALPGQRPDLPADGASNRDASLSQHTPGIGSTGSRALAHSHGQDGALRPPQAFSRDSIPGWGADLDPNVRPGVPMERRPPRLPAGAIKPLAQQPKTVEVFHSPERPGITPIFGTSTPPAGLSGTIRRAAYKLTENDIRHWLLLLVADRVNVVEGIGQDLARGKVPNVLAEMGIAAEWKYNKAGLARKVAITGAVLGIGWYLMQGRKRS
ncbi:MAG: hypothetical protein ACJ8HI_10725 [Massilia sp.]